MSDYNKKCQKCRSKGHMTEACLLNYVICFNCDETGHFANFCPYPLVNRMVCFKCEGIGHSANICPYRRDKKVMSFKFNETGQPVSSFPYLVSKKIICSNCGKSGHKEDSCSYHCNKNICHNCGKQGHDVDSCMSISEPVHISISEFVGTPVSESEPVLKSIDEPVFEPVSESVSVSENYRIVTSKFQRVNRPESIPESSEKTKPPVRKPTNQFSISYAVAALKRADKHQPAEAPPKRDF